jgi:hypothetical protein
LSPQIDCFIAGQQAQAHLFAIIYDLAYIKADSQGKGAILGGQLGDLPLPRSCTPYQRLKPKFRSREVVLVLVLVVVLENSQRHTNGTK